MKKTVIILITAMILIAGCAEVMKVLESAAVAPLTEQDVVGGLKEALITGAKNSAGRLSVTDGYYSDMAVRILLPDEAKVIVDNISKIPGGDKLIEDVVIRINRAAEDAAKEVAPVFVTAVTGMTVSDAFGILRGADNAATEYLHRTTYNQLYSLYKPKIEASTRKKIVAGISTSESWEALTGRWNSFAGSVAGRLAGFNTVNTNLDDFLTRKALDGLFMKVEEEELKIRKDVSARITPLLRKVFGSLDTK
ncbi:MAG: DUF4197 domain-containing protein [Bacteroidetes bacterium]|nr:DUF4197 domain-containing protein [Bacteroidota bacterium]